MHPRYPIYIVSKGRYEKRMTADSLETMGVDYFMVVEPHEQKQYSDAVGAERVLVLPLSNHGNGPGLARNYAWEHSIQLGAKRHWVMDDNINGFYRLNYNLKIQCNAPELFSAMEDFCDRYSNVKIAGPNYFMFASRKTIVPTHVWNTRIYSCLLIENDTPFRWRGRYNEDTDLSLRVLKAGLCTVQFNAFLQYKTPTQALKGGNTAEFYDKEGTRNKSLMLERMHPDVAKMVWKWGRWHHEVNYEPFKNNKPIFRKGYKPEAGANDYGMKLVVDENFKKRK